MQNSNATTVATQSKPNFVESVGAEVGRDAEQNRIAYITRRGVPPERVYLVATLAFSTVEAARG